MPHTVSNTHCFWRLSLIILLALTSLMGRPAISQDAPPYQHPLFTGPIHEISQALFDLNHVRVALRFEPEERKIYGVARLRLQALSDTVTVLPLVAQDFDVYSLILGASNSALLPSTFVTDSTSFINIPLDSLESATELFEVQIVYAASPKAGLTFTSQDPEDPDLIVWTSAEPGSQRHWLPLPATGWDKTTSEVLLSVPPQLRAVSNGLMINVSTTEDGLTQYHFVQDQPHAVVDIGMMMGPFDIQDQRLRMSNGYNVPYVQWLQSGLEGDADLTFEATGSILDYYSTITGQLYPWPGFSQVVLKGLFMDAYSLTGLSFVNDRILQDERSRLDFNPEPDLAKSIARQWAHHQLAPDHVSERWINDGLAAYLAGMYLEQSAGFPSFALYMEDLRKEYLAETQEYLRPLVWDRWEHPSQLDDAHSSAKGAWVYHMLRAKIGEEPFHEGLKRLFLQYRFDMLNSDNLREVFEAASGTSLRGFFDEWVFSAGHPVLSTTFAFDDASSTLSATVEQRQEGFLVPAHFTVDLALESYSLAGQEHVQMTLDNPESTATFELTMAPRYIAPDFNHVLLAEIKHEQAMPAWVAQLRYTPHPVSQIEAAQALLNHFDEPTLPIGLQSALRSRPAEEVRASIFRLMGHLPYSEALQRSLTQSFQEETPLVQRAILDALVQQEDHPNAVTLAMDAAQTAQSYQLQADAVWTIAAVQKGAAFDLIQSALVTPSYQDIIRQRALSALPFLELGTAELVALGKEHLDPSHSTETRLAAMRHLYGLATLQNRASLAAIIDLIADEDAAIRREAITMLGRLGAEQALAVLENHRNAESYPSIVRRTDEAIAQIRSQIE